MRIELNAGGLGGAITVAAFALSYDKMLNEAKAVAATFKTVKRMTSQANGGVGNLQPALDSIEARLRAEEQKIEKIATTQKKLGEFIVHTIKTDTKVAVMVAVNREMFYLVNPWARPSFGNFVRKVVKIVGSTIKKMWNSVVNFFKKHGKAIIKFAVPVLMELGLAVFTYFCPPAATVTVPLMKDIAIGTLIGVATEGIKEGYSYYKEHGTLSGSFDRIFDAAAGGALSGSIGGIFETFHIPFGGTVGNFVNAIVDGKGWDYIKNLDFLKDIVTEHFAGKFADMFKLGESVIGKIGSGVISTVAQEFLGWGYDKLKDAAGGIVSKVVEIANSYSNVKEVVHSGVIGIGGAAAAAEKSGQVWNGFQAMNVDFTHTFKDFVAEKYDLPVLPGGVAQVDNINSGIHNVVSGNAGGNSVTGHSHGGNISIPIVPPQITPTLPQQIIAAGHTIGSVIGSIVHPTPLPIPTVIPPIDIRDIIRPVDIHININVIFRPSSMGAVVA
jgi:hypothetical protein